MPQELSAWIRALQATDAAAAAGRTLPALLPNLAAVHGDRIALCGDGGTLTYRALAQRAEAVAGWAGAEDLLPGQVVCLLMPNAPEYVATWLGLGRAGIVVALINTNLAGDAVLHSIAAAGATGLIVAQPLLPTLQAIAARLDPALLVWVHGGDGSAWPAFQPNPQARPPARLPAPGDRALLVFTSGTTGLPKAAIISHARVMEWAYWFAGLMDARPDDRVYDCLPLYHSVGGIIAVTSMLVSGGSVLIRERFSATRFWDDVAANGCTILQYIGELCRYLLAVPASPAERGHRLRLACGNGLGSDIWQAVQQRFALPQILEFYAATEGGVSLYNVAGQPGAVGRVPAVLRHRLGIALVRIDPDTGAPARGAAGHCIACADDEAGEAIGRLGPGRRFDGYTDAAASSAKLLADVFEPGDHWFRTGDLLRRDAAGYYYFVDRIGDSYRWKGENVSATEVTAVLRAYPGVSDAAVYGVRVPGHDGRAGMAALTTASPFDWQVLHAHLAAALPGYARPLFVRLCPALELTGTFKLVKAALAQEGFLASRDPVWLFDRRAGRYVPLDPAMTAAIGAGDWRA